MPHIWVEYSANLLPEVQVDALLKVVQDAAIGDGAIFPLAGARTRGVRVDEYRIVDGHPDNAFVHVLFRIGPGRRDSDKQQAGARIMHALQDHLAPVVQTRPIGISVQLQEAIESLNFKFSNYRSYLAQRSAGSDDSPPAGRLP